LDSKINKEQKEFFENAIAKGEMQAEPSGKEKSFLIK
jgi:molecular chaperone DnaJ